MKTIYIKRNDLFKNIPMILCNNIINADPNFFEDNMDVYYYECEECDGNNEECEECGGEGRHESEPYQIFLADMDSYTKGRLESFGVVVGYSDLLDCHVIPIYDFGTSWDAFSYSKEVENNYKLGWNETVVRTTVY